MKIKTTLIAIVVFCYAIVSSQGAVIYTDQASFLSNVGIFETEDFESYPLIGDTGSGAVDIYSFADFTVSSIPPAIKLLGAPFVGNHNTTVGGSKYLSFDTDLGGVGTDATLTFHFDVSPIYSFGLYLIDLEMSAQVVVNGINYNVPSTGSGGEAYFGIVSDIAFSSVILDGGSTDSHWSIDDISYTAIPEPSSLATISLVSGLGLFIRRKFML